MLIAAWLGASAAADDMAKWWQPVDRQPTPVPARIGISDVEQVESITSVMRALDYRYGGGACRDAVAAQVAWAQQLLGSRYAEEVRLRLHLALADLHDLAGWTSFDVGRCSPARRHLARALEQARAADDASLVVSVLYRMGRLHLHRGMLKEALRFFQLGQIAAQDSGLTPNRTERRFGKVVPTTSPSPARPAGRRWWVRRSGRGRVQRDAERVACWGRGVRGPRA